MMIMKFAATLVFGISTVCLGGWAAAQDEDVQGGEHSVEMAVIGGDGIGAPMIIQTTEDFGNGERRSGMRIMSGGGAMGGMTFFGSMDGEFDMPAPDPWSMLSNPSVQKDLELVGDQLKKVQDLQAQFAEEMKEQIGDIRQGGLSPERLKDLPKLMEKLQAQQREQMESMLLPHQISRLHQVALQTHMNRAGTVNALASEKIAEELGLTNEQIERLQKRSKELNAQLAKDTAALKEKAKEDLLNELSLDQRNKLKELTGDKFEQKTEDWEERLNRRRPQRRVRGGN